MEAISKTIGNFTIYFGKVLLPVILSSLVFSGILAKYNNAMNLNKSILESAYQPMKQQYRECARAQGHFLGQLSAYRASVGSLQEFIQLGLAPPATFWKHREHSAYHNVTTLRELDDTWGKVMACYEVFTSLLTDVSLMLGDEGLELTEVIDGRKIRLDSLKRNKDEIINKMYQIELEGLFAVVRESSVHDIKKTRKEWGKTLNIAMSTLEELKQMAADASEAQHFDFDFSDEIATKALKKRFETGPFEFFTRLTR
jgi:hypothetical protein